MCRLALPDPIPMKNIGRVKLDKPNQWLILLQKMSLFDFTQLDVLGTYLHINPMVEFVYILPIHGQKQPAFLLCDLFKEEIKKVKMTSMTKAFSSRNITKVKLLLSPRGTKTLIHFFYLNSTRLNSISLTLAVNVIL